MSTELEGQDPYRQCLRAAVSSLATEAGFDIASPLPLETLIEVMQGFISEVGRSSRAYCELAARTEPVVADVVLALVEMGVSVQGIQEYSRRVNRTTVTAPNQAVASKQTAILHTGNKKRHPPHIPDNLPDMPDSHSYIRTPTHKQPVTDYESVREKAASQKRDVERALTRFIAKTGQIHNLLLSDDNNLFPLISCDRDEGPRLPAYIDALLFKDQVFEEDEREFLPKKRKSDKDFDDDDDEEDKTKQQQNESVCESETIDNPYLRACKMPRVVNKTVK